MQNMYYIGLDVHKRTISYCVKDGSGTIHAEGTIPATRFDLDRWMKTLPQPWTAAMEATVFTGWIVKFYWSAERCEQFLCPVASE
jgi:transposase